MWKSRQDFYNSTEWKAMAKRIKARDNNICQRCYNKRVVQAYKRGDKHVKMIVHHKTWLDDNNYNDRNISLNPDNLETVCIFCHNDIHEGNCVTVPGVKFDAEGNLVKDGQGGITTPRATQTTTTKEC